MAVEDLTQLHHLLGDETESLLTHRCKVPLQLLHQPGPDWIDRIFGPSDRNLRVLRNLQTLFGHGRLAHTGYLSILPVDQGVEHAAGASFAANPIYFDPEHIVQLALEAGCSAVASTYGVLSFVARRYAHKIPFILKYNHNELLSYPNTFDQTPFSTIRQAYDLGAVAVGATIYFGSPEAKKEIREVSQAFAEAHELGMATILWCYLRNPAFTTSSDDYHNAADLTGQADHLGATLGADIVKQKLPITNRGFTNLKFGKSDPRVYSTLSSDHPIDLCRYQVLNAYSGRAGTINSGGPSSEHDLRDAVRTAIINKRAGGMGLILGRKAFQKPLQDGISLIRAVQDIYLNPHISLA